MMGGGAQGATLEAAIRQSRSLNADGTKAIYNLLYGIDFSKPRVTAEAIARVVWEEDIQAWWSVQDGKAVCSPTRQIEIHLPDEHNRKIAKTVDEFKADLMNEELGDHLGGYLDSVSNYSVDWATVFLMGPLWAYLAEKSEIKQRRQEELGKLFAQMSGHISVVTQ